MEAIRNAGHAWHCDGKFQSQLLCGDMLDVAFQGEDTVMKLHRENGLTHLRCRPLSHLYVLRERLQKGFQGRRIIDWSPIERLIELSPIVKGNEGVPGSVIIDLRQSTNHVPLLS